MIGAVARKLFGSANERRIRSYQPRVKAINALEPEVAALSDEALKARIEAAIPGSTADVTDLTGTGYHFRATVVAPEFAGLSRIEQHRRVYAVFGPDIGGPIHALSLVTKAES